MLVIDLEEISVPARFMSVIVRLKLRHHTVNLFRPISKASYSFHNAFTADIGIQMER